MDKIDLSSFKGLYLKTAREYIDKIDASIEVLLKQPENPDAIMNIYISAHSLGSQSTLTGYKNVESVCRVIEDLFKKIKEGKAKGGTGRRLPKVSQELLSALNRSLTSLTNCVDSIEKENSEVDLSSIKNQLEKM